jgi:hypothetical protein
MHHEIERIHMYNGERPGPNLFFSGCTWSRPECLSEKFHRVGEGIAFAYPSINPSMGYSMGSKNESAAKIHHGEHREH